MVYDRGPMARQIYEFNLDKITDHTKLIRELHLSLIETELTPYFKFRAGQFVMLHVPTAEGKPALRAYSIATTEENTKGFRLIFKFVDNGVASNFVWALKEQQKLQFTGPFGKVFFQEPPTEQVVFLNTGSGVSQHFCFLESKMKQFPNLKFRMYFGVRYEEDIYYRKELEALKSNLKNFTYDYVVSRPNETWKGKKGYVQNFLNETEYRSVPTTFYLCGNGAMIKDVKKELIENNGVDPQRIWAEAFD